MGSVRSVCRRARRGWRSLVGVREGDAPSYGRSVSVRASGCVVSVAWARDAQSAVGSLSRLVCRAVRALVFASESAFGELPFTVRGCDLLVAVGGRAVWLQLRRTIACLLVVPSPSELYRGGKRRKKKRKVEKNPPKGAWFFQGRLKACGFVVICPKSLELVVLRGPPNIGRNKIQNGKLVKDIKKWVTNFGAKNPDQCPTSNLSGINASKAW